MIFVSHSSQDDQIVSRLRNFLQLRGVPVWSDSHQLVGGQGLGPEIESAIQQADAVLVVVSPSSLESAWVAREIRFALSNGKRVVPILCEPLTPADLRRLFTEEPLAVVLRQGPGGLEATLPPLFAALGLHLPTEVSPEEPIRTEPLADLELRLREPRFVHRRGATRAAATARLIYHPLEGPAVESPDYAFRAPIGPLQAEDLTWYLEKYLRWPGQPFRQRAEEVEKQLPEWGRLLHEALLPESGREPFDAWNAAGNHAVTHRFTVSVDTELPGRASASKRAKANAAATSLLGLPWELLHDGRGYLFQGGRPVRVRRRLPGDDATGGRPTAAPIRVLLASPRPEDVRAAYFDYRSGLLPIVTALSPLGSLVDFTILTPPTFPALLEELNRAAPYHIVHFDGHGVYDPAEGQAFLCFEDPADVGKAEGRRTRPVSAGEVGAEMRHRNVPLVFLGACQSATAESDLSTSAAGALLQAGVDSVIAMSHSVLVETAHRFATAFYERLAQGERIGSAMLAGQRALHDDPTRGKAFRGEPLKLHDWFVPVLFQLAADPQLIPALPGPQVRAMLGDLHELALGSLPKTPPHGFVGRSRELLQAERILERERSVVLRGSGGEGKTTLAAELARWLVLTRRYSRAVFISAEKHRTWHKVLSEIGDQIVPEYVQQSAGDEERGWMLVQRELEETPTLIVLDNMESVPPRTDLVDHRLLQTGQTRLVFTSRESLPEPYGRNELRVGRLDRADAIALVGRVLREGRWMPGAQDEAASEAAIERLVEAVSCHARALVLLTGEIVASGVVDAAERIEELIGRLAAKYPNDRERSLVASLQLSLARLPTETRQAIGPLGALRGGGSITLMSLLIEMESEEVAELARQLVDRGLAEMPEGYLRFDPALSHVLLEEMSDGERREALDRWARTIERFTHFLDTFRLRDPFRAARAVDLEMDNLVGALEYLSESEPADSIAVLAARLQSLIGPLEDDEALRRVMTIREQAEAQLGSWSRAAWQTALAEVNSLYESGRYSDALTCAQRLLHRAEAAGETAYHGAALDMVEARVVMAQILGATGSVKEALPLLEQAHADASALARTSATTRDADRIAGMAMGALGVCLFRVGQLKRAGEALTAAITSAEQRDDSRSVALHSLRLAQVREREGEHDGALQAFASARDVFLRLGEKTQVAVCWSYIGRLHRAGQEYDDAEAAFLEALRINTNPREELAILSDLGALYAAMGRREDAVRFHRQAASIAQTLRDREAEGRCRNDAAMELLTLEQYAEAREEAIRSLECKLPFGHSAMIWTTYFLLERIERELGNKTAAAAAREKSIEHYLAYRRAGGENRMASGQLVRSVTALMGQGQAGRALALLDQQPPFLQNFSRALQALVLGIHESFVADDPRLDYDEVVELRLLLEGLVPAAARSTLPPSS